MMQAPKILFTNAIWKVILFSLSFFINFLLVRAFRAALAAEFYSSIYWFALVVQVFTFGLDIGLSYSVSRRLLTVQEAGSVIILVVVFALALSLPSVYLFFRNSPGHLIGIAQKMLFAFLYISGTLFTSLSTAIFSGIHKNHLATQIACGISFVFLTGLLIIFFLRLPALTQFTLLGSYFMIVFIQGLITFFVCIMQHGGTRPFRWVRVGILKELLTFSGLAFFINLIFFVGTRFSIYLIPSSAAAADVGNYMQVFKIIEFLLSLVSFIYYPFLAIVSGASSGGTEKQVLSLLRLANTFTLLVSISGAVCGFYLFPLFYGASFNKMYSIFLFFIPGLIAAGSSNSISVYFFGKARNLFNFWSASILLFVSVFVYLLFRQHYTITVAAVSFSLASIASYATDLVLFRRLYPYRFRDISLINAADIRQIRMLLTGENQA